MRVISSLLVTVVVCVILVACGAAPETLPVDLRPTALPIPSEGQVAAPAGDFSPTATPLVRATLPPTWTPIGFVASETPTITLTPSVTLTVTPSATFTPSITPPPPVLLTNEAFLAQPTAEVCADFAIDVVRNSVSVPLGSDVDLFWLPLNDAVGYQVLLFNDAFELTYQTITTDMTTRLSADLFMPQELYAWQVVPLAASGLPLCPARGSSLIAVPAAAP